MRSYAILLVMLSVVVSGCGSLRPDPHPAAIDKNYPSVEMTCGAERFNGLGACGYVAGSGPVRIVVQGYYKGRVRADSERCQIAETRSYEGNDVVVFEVRPERSCLIDFVLSPSYPKSSGVDVSSIKGRFYIKYLQPGQEWMHFESKVLAGLDEQLDIPFDEDARVLAAGCGAHYDQFKPLQDGHVSVRVSELGINRPDCLYEIIVYSARRTLRVSWMIWQYQEGYVPLARPIIRLKGKKIEVVADSSVGILSFNSSYKLSNKATFSQTTGVLRVITAKGRILLGLLENGKVIRWIP